MKCAVLFGLLAVAAAAPMAEESGASVSEKEYPAAVKKALDEALEERPKKARQLFHEDLVPRRSRTLRRRLRKLEKDSEEEGDKKVSESSPELGQAEGWSPMEVSPRSHARSLDLADSAELTSDDSVSSEGSGSSEDAEDSAASAEDGKTSNSYLSPLYAPAPGGYGSGSGSGYGYGYGPSIYILPIVLPPPGGHGGHPVGRHVVTETGHHESHHFSGGHGADYRPIYAGAHGVPPIYIPKGYGVHSDVHHGVHHGGYGGHTSVHREDKTIIRDIDPPVFKA
ncbi:hypothetical protein FJT64_015796 [Amphibalanus amphitrite]|uniref:Uncharacterized protein n=1 Tax=Amphibalanus amphitrite TaxID=1232801 RepID=A0A6A4X310_AMPAM|nr:uncharacterized protein LOC122372229 [Amphibalanus amphitrite]KAF0313657.1 hypothetical protein FJT64_015796 [Amphibalanus amphitrite]